MRVENDFLTFKLKSIKLNGLQNNIRERFQNRLYANSMVSSELKLGIFTLVWHLIILSGIEGESEEVSQTI